MGTARARARALADAAIGRGEPLAWFDELYDIAAGDPRAIQWADLSPNPHLLAWLGHGHTVGERALVVGCGLGDDAEELARRGCRVTAFDISPTAVAWCRMRFPDSPVAYVGGDALAPNPAWAATFDVVFEAYTLQVLQTGLRAKAIAGIAGCLAPSGTLLVVARGREPADDPGAMPWPLARRELDRFTAHGLVEVTFEDFFDDEVPPTRRFRVEYRRPSNPEGVGPDAPSDGR